MLFLIARDYLVDAQCCSPPEASEAAGIASASTYSKSHLLFDFN